MCFGKGMGGLEIDLMPLLFNGLLFISCEQVLGIAEKSDLRTADIRVSRTRGNWGNPVLP